MSWLFWRAPFLYRRCLITTKSEPDAAFDGVLFEARGAWLVLKHCTLVRAGAAPLPLDGDVVIHIHNFAFAQVKP